MRIPKIPTRTGTPAATETTPSSAPAGGESTVVVEQKLRRAITPWGSYTWGYADVGADIYVALGLVIATAEGLANVAFLFAGLVYVCVGLAYTELSAMYPMAGGGQLFVHRGLGDFWGFVAGWAVLLDFTIDIALFAYFSAGYINYFFPVLSRPPWIIIQAAALVLFLFALNVIGVRETTLLNQVVASIDIVTETTLIFIGFLFAWSPAFYWHQTTQALLHFDSSKLLFGASLAIISFVGLESIAQASQETERPTTIVPRTSVALILTILAYALAMSNLALGMVPWQSFDPSSTQLQYCHHLSNTACSNEHLAHENAPVVWLAHNLPLIGPYTAPIIAIVGAILLLISSNAGLYGSSRIMYSMATHDLVPKVFTHVQPRFRTPTVALSVFTAIALVELIFAGLTANAVITLGDLYAFGAATSYTLVFISLLVLRYTDQQTPRTFRVPWNVRLRWKDKVFEEPIVGVLGLIGISSVLVAVILTHPIGRIAGPVWITLGLVGYYFYRKSRGQPFRGSVKRDWSREQLAVYEQSGETELADEYREALRHGTRKPV
jgi:APA family basic amino acid/polyamine antiporter